MKTPKILYVCRECGATSIRWLGKCPDCGAWNSFDEETAPEEKPAARAPRAHEHAEKFSELTLPGYMRTKTGMEELDRVLGGGLVDRSAVLLSGEPGIGKSTLLLQICSELGKARRVLYVSVEESKGQLKLRAERLGIKGDNIYLLTETDIESVLDECETLRPDVIIIDSVQTLTLARFTSAPGSITQVREGAMAFINYGKTQGAAIFLVGHVNKEGGISGPKFLEHMVDAVLYFEGERTNSYRIIRAIKNRFGSTNEVGVFEMRGSGLVEVANPSEFMLQGKPEDAPGSVVACSMEGTRPILVEVQGLVCQTNFNYPKRTAAGIDFNRVNLLLAVLEKRLGVRMNDMDAYINVAGGMRLNEPAVDMGIVLAILSSYRNQVIDGRTICFGEIGLVGEVRAVSMAEARVQEAAKLGFERCILPEVNRRQLDLEQMDLKGLKLIGISNVYELLEIL